MLARHDHDNYEFVLGENDVIEQQSGHQVRITVKVLPEKIQSMG